eukprot:14747479-Ditylum_brightwellii.AAC.1
MDDLEEAMAIQFCIRYGKTEDKGSDGKEVTLAAFNRKCYNCGESGHMANECPNKKQGKKKFQCN